MYRNPLTHSVCQMPKKTGSILRTKHGDTIKNTAQTTSGCKNELSLKLVGKENENRDEESQPSINMLCTKEYTKLPWMSAHATV